MSNTIDEKVIVGQGDYRYECVPNWPNLPEGWNFVEATAVATDKSGNVFVFNRGNHPLVVFDRNGDVVANWGEGDFVRPHGITMTPDGAAWLVDDCDHTVHKYSLAGEQVMTLGTSGKPSDTGATSIDYRTITHSGPPFHYPTNVAVGKNGELFIADGYGNARVHKFSPTGECLASWGEPGDGPGQFHVPHGIAVDSQGVIYVADRENDRLQLFDEEGRYLDSWDGLARPAQVFIDADDVFYIVEIGYKAGMWPGTVAPSPDATGGRLSIFSRERELLSRWGGGEHPGELGDFFAPHDICVDGEGTIYVAEVGWSAGGKNGVVPADIRSLHKFVRTNG